MTTSALPQASRGTLEAAKSGAAGPHARINLKRMVVRLEARSRPHNDDDEGEERWEDLSLEQLRTEWQTVCYAKALYEELESEGTSSSSTSAAEVKQNLERMEHRMKPIWARKVAQEQAALPHQPAPPIRHLSSMNLPPPLPSPQASMSSVSPSANLEVTPILDRSVRESSPMAMNTPAPIQANYDDDEWGIRKERDAQYELLPLKTPREQLLGDAEGRGAYGSGVGGAAALHEELGSGLADMSHRLKLNALHFANSLEEEKKLLEGSEGLLENNLARTTTSKKTLSTVSRKSRGTTCLTLGACVVVMVAWFWTYLLIRMT